MIIDNIRRIYENRGWSWVFFQLVFFEQNEQKKPLLKNVYFSDDDNNGFFL